MENRSADVSMKLNIYTKTVDEAAILTYLDEAEQMTPYAVIISSILTDAIREKLEKMIKNTFILILSEFGEMKNSFYIGDNSYEDGYRLGQL